MGKAVNPLFGIYEQPLKQMFIINPYRFGGGGAAFTYYSTLFDGTNDYLSASSLSGLADSKVGTLSVWLKLTGLGSFIWMEKGLRIVDFFGYVRIAGRNSDGNVILQLDSIPTTLYPNGSWFHLLASWNMATANASWMYFDDTDVTVSRIHTDGTIDYTPSSNYVICANDSGTNKLNGLISECYFANEYLDISNSSNRLKFRTAGGKPADLGADGSTPTGTQPLIYLHNPYSSFETNLGSGGNFTVTGALGDGGADIP